MVVLDSEYVFPLVQQRAVNPVSIGSAFYIGNKIFITAGHCLQSHPEEKIVIFLPEDGDNLSAHIGVEISDIEILDCDIGLFRISEEVPNRVKAKSWKMETIPAGSDVIFTGYPSTIIPDWDLSNFYSRTFKTVVSAHRNWFRLDNKPLIYETVGLCRVGLSGSPLEWIPTGKDLKKYQLFPIVGVVVASEKESCEVFRSTSKEIVDGKIVDIVKVFEEASHFGVAISGENFSTLRSTKILNGNTVYDHLFAAGLIS